MVKTMVLCDIGCWLDSRRVLFVTPQEGNHGSDGPLKWDMRAGSDEAAPAD